MVVDLVLPKYVPDSDCTIFCSLFTFTFSLYLFFLNVSGTDTFPCFVVSSYFFFFILTR